LVYILALQCINPDSNTDVAVCTAIYSIFIFVLVYIFLFCVFCFYFLFQVQLMQLGARAPTLWRSSATSQSHGTDAAKTDDARAMDPGDRAPQPSSVALKPLHTLHGSNLENFIFICFSFCVSFSVCCF
jgi:hypothetical protein